jgi:superfamily I DNA/RNA helicase
MTFEQGAIVSCKDRNLIVQAYAGTGKTSTLVKYAEARPGERMLYLAFNKAVQMEGQARFPRNVECRTTHSLAYREFGAPYREKLGQPRPLEVSRAMNCTLNKAQHALDTVMAWCCSGDDQIELEHFAQRHDPKFEPTYPGEIRALARQVWRRMKDLHDPALRMPHDGYLKLYQLSRPDLSRYGRILFDECQDANPVTTNIVMSQRCGVVMVGDAHQAIYQFRGAKNALATAPETWRRMTLTRSFRFGPGVAEVANVLLGLKGETSKIIGGGPHQTRWEVDHAKQYTTISRTNAGLIEIAASHPEATLAWVGGLQSYPIERVIDAYNLKLGMRGNVRDPSLLAFTDWTHVKTYAGSVNDPELNVLIRLVEEHGGSLPEMVADIRRRSIDCDKTADMILTTAHRSKGLEWDQVMLADDFIDLAEDEAEAKRKGLPGCLTEAGADDLNVLYVAASRALKCIELPSALVTYLHTRPELARNRVLAPMLGYPDPEPERTPAARTGALRRMAF